MGDQTDTKKPGKQTPAKKPPAKQTDRPPTRGRQASPQQRAAGNSAMAKQSAPVPVTSPSRIAYGSTELSQEALRVRRANPAKSGDQNLVVVKYSVRTPGASGPPTEVIASIWNSPTIAHSEQELPGYFEKIKEQHGGKAQITVQGIFSERQFCGPSGQDCQHLINSRYPAAQKEFAYNYQMPPDVPKREGENTRNVIRDRIEAFRDSGRDIDESTRRDPPPYEERARGRIPSQVVPPPKKSGGGGTEGGAAPAQAEPAAGTPAPAKPVAETPAKPTPEAPAKPTPEAPAKPTPEAPAKPTPEAPAKPTPEPSKPTTEPKKPTTEAPAKPKPEPGKPTPSTSTSDTPSASKPTSSPSKPAPGKPSASTPATAKPAASEPATSEPAASKPAGKSATVSQPVPGKAGGSGGAAMKAATGATGAMMAQAMSQLNKLSAQSQDKDLASAVNALNKAMDVKSFVDNPTRFAAEKVKAEIIQGVFNHFSRSADRARQSFESRFPDVPTLRMDPTGNGVSLEQHEKNYRQALAALRVPDARKALVYTAVALGLGENTPEEEIERRIAIANRELAKLPGLEKYVKNYYAASDKYSFAIVVVNNRVNLRRDDFPQQPAAIIDDLNRRAGALERIANIFEDTKQQLWQSGLVVWAPILAVASDMETLAVGFRGLGGQLRSFANMIGSRQGEYDRELSRLEAESSFIARQAVRPF